MLSPICFGSSLGKKAIPGTMNGQESHLRNLASFLLPWSRPPINKWQQARNMGFQEHQQLTRTCHEYRDTDYWMRAFMLKWKNEAAASGQSLSITVRIRWIAAADERPEQNEPLQLQPSRKFAHFFLSRPCSSFCGARTQSIEGRASRNETNSQTHTIQVTDSAQASEILRELARPLSNSSHGGAASEPSRLRRHRRSNHPMDDSENIDPLDRSQQP